MGQIGIWLTILITIALSVGAIVGASRYWRVQNLKKEEERRREEGEVEEEGEDKKVEKEKNGEMIWIFRKGDRNEVIYYTYGGSLKFYELKLIYNTEY